MTLSDILILVAIAAMVVAAWTRIRRDKKNGKCSCGCSGCTQKCDERDKNSLGN